MSDGFEVTGVVFGLTPEDLAERDRKVALRAWEAGLKAGEEYANSLWRWSAGETSRLMHGLTERPTRPENPHL